MCSAALENLPLLIASDMERTCSTAPAATCRPPPSPIPSACARAKTRRALTEEPAGRFVALVVIGNPPFLGGKLMRDALGDAYVDALFRAWKGLS